MKHLAVILIAIVLVVTIGAFVACGANAGVTATADEKKEIRIVASDTVEITVQEFMYNGWRLLETVQMVEYHNNGALIKITYADGTFIVSAATNYLVRVRTK